ncbi:hypothetical protein FNT36_20910 [Hymenobacter setariae]|uniref:TonB-dependent receptor n=1 Tax=Hymenobacter setariae TaxID=2594794 RepID=A0A558BM93_9BACT|nr:hypothetical protein [Hymenobacter setariae]TVT37637.1 hypothetical protein FNT36_20910 [Hymenobacter setariae]
MPMQGAAPEIRAKGEVEITGSWALSDRVDFGVTYSPVPHLLVRAATSFKGSRPGPGQGLDSASYAKNNQYELAVGTYWPLGQHWLVGGLAGFGRAHAQARYIDDGSTLFTFREPIRHQLDGNYSKYSGEAYATFQPSPLVSLGLAYRVVQLRLTDITDQGVPVATAPILRQEPMFYFRLRPEFAQRSLQLQLALGASNTFGYRRGANDEADPARQFKLGRSYTSVGIAFFPHLLKQKK